MTVNSFIFNQNKFLSCTLDRFEGQFAVLATEDGQTINWPQDKLPPDAAEGSQIKLVMFSAKTEEEEREKMAKAVLNEILKTE